MANYKIQHSCGHNQTTQLYGPNKERDRKIEWLEKQLCLDCKKKEAEEQRKKQTKEAEQFNKNSGATPLTGSEKQVAWAETLRWRALLRLSATIERLSKTTEVSQTVTNCLNKTKEWLIGITEAQWWIDEIGSLKTEEPTSAILSIFSGKLPNANETEILRHILLESPHCNQEVASLLHIGEQYREKLTNKLAKSAKAEALATHQKQKPTRPKILQEARDKIGDSYNWNKKIYGRRIYISNTEIKLTESEEKEITDYLKAFSDWKNKETALTNT